LSPGAHAGLALVGVGAQVSIVACLPLGRVFRGAVAGGGATRSSHVALIARHRTFLERSVETEAALAQAVRRTGLALAARTIENRRVNALVGSGIAAIDGAFIVVIAGREAGWSVGGPRFWPGSGIANLRDRALAAAGRAQETQTNRRNDMAKWRRSRKHRFVGLHVEGNAVELQPLLGAFGDDNGEEFVTTM
jgi:hypothetical protein